MKRTLCTPGDIVAADPLRDYLSEHADFRVSPAKTTTKNLVAWLAEVDVHARGGARAAYLVGRVLLARRAKLKHGTVAAWTNEQTASLDRAPRTIRLYMQVAEAIDELATPLPISVLDRPLRDVPRAIRNLRAGRDEDAGPLANPKPKIGKVQQWKLSAKCLLTSIPKGTSRHDLLRAHFMATYHELLKLDPTLADVQSSDADDEFPFALAAAAAIQTEKPVPSSVLKARRKVRPFFSYPGGKSQVVDTLIDAIGVLQRDGMNGDEVFREPFTGGGSVAINMLATGRAGRVWLNDMEPGVVALWNAAIHEHEALIRRVMAAQPTVELIDDLTAKQEASALSGLDLAVSELLIRQCSYGSAGRMVGGTRSDVLSKWSPKSTCKRIAATHQLLRGRVEHGECTTLDAIDVITAPGLCFLYVDPPYVRAGNELYPHSFGPADHERLAEALKTTDQPWLLSYDEHELVRELYQSDVIDLLSVARPHGARRKKGRRTRENELLICPAGHADILRPDRDADLIGDLFGTECGVE